MLLATSSKPAEPNAPADPRIERRDELEAQIREYAKQHDDSIYEVFDKIAEHGLIRHELTECDNWSNQNEVHNPEWSNPHETTEATDADNDEGYQQYLRECDEYE